MQIEFLNDICVISDTHDLLRPEVLAGIEGCKAILHAGDIGSRSVLSELQKLAPVYAVQSNCWLSTCELTYRI